MQANLTKKRYETLDESTLERLGKEHGCSFRNIGGEVVAEFPDEEMEVERPC